MSKRKFNNEVNEINELLKILRVSNNKKKNESPVSKKKKSGSPVSSKKGSGSPVSSKKRSRSPVSSKKGSGSPVSSKKGSGSPVSNKKRSRSLSPDSSPPTEANKKTARKLRVFLTKMVNGKYVNKTKQELLRDIAYKKQYIQREENFRKRFPLNNYQYINENIYYNFLNEYARNINSKLNDYVKNMKNFENEGRQTYGIYNNV
jgi:hypothetical protein